MKVTHHPTGQAEPKVYQFDPEDERESALERMEKAYAKLIGQPIATVDQLILGVTQGQSTARRVLLWHLQGREHPSIRIEDVDPTRRELLVEADRADLVWLRGQYAKQAAADPQVQTLLESIDAQIRDMDAAPEGKALSPSAGDATG